MHFISICHDLTELWVMEKVHFWRKFSSFICLCLHERKGHSKSELSSFFQWWSRLSWGNNGAVTFSLIFSILRAALRLWWRSSIRNPKTGSTPPPVPDTPFTRPSWRSASRSLVSALIVSTWYMWYVFITLETAAHNNSAVNIKWKTTLHWSQSGIFILEGPLLSDRQEAFKALKEPWHLTTKRLVIFLQDLRNLVGRKPESRDVVNTTTQ